MKQIYKVLHIMPHKTGNDVTHLGFTDDKTGIMTRYNRTDTPDGDRPYLSFIRFNSDVLELLEV